MLHWYLKNLLTFGWDQICKRIKNEKNGDYNVCTSIKCFKIIIPSQQTLLSRIFFRMDLDSTYHDVTNYVLWFKIEYQKMMTWHIEGINNEKLGVREESVPFTFHSWLNEVIGAAQILCQVANNSWWGVHYSFNWITRSPTTTLKLFEIWGSVSFLYETQVQTSRWRYLVIFLVNIFRIHSAESPPVEFTSFQWETEVGIPNTSYIPKSGNSGQ